MSKKAYKYKMGFLTEAREEKYRLFLKQHILNLEPKFYAVVQQLEVSTSDGQMFVLRITKDIEHPGFETIAEAWINGQHIYLWRDHCWGIAVDKNNKQIIRYGDIYTITHGPDIITGSQTGGLKTKSNYVDKTMLLFKIGIDEV